MTSTITRLHGNLVTNWRVDSLDDYAAFVGGTGGAGTLFRGTATPPTGFAAHARTFVSTAPTAGTRYITVSNSGSSTNAVSPGAVYRFTTQARGNLAGTIQLQIQWLDAGGSVLSTSTAAAAASGSWGEFTMTGTAPASAVRATLVVRLNPTSGTLAINDYVDATGLELRREPAAGDIITPILVDGYEGTRELRSVAHPIANSGHVAVALIPAGPRKGTLRLLFGSAADATAAAALLALPALFVFADTETPELNMTFLPTDGNLAAVLDNETRARWIVTVPFMEVLP